MIENLMIRDNLLIPETESRLKLVPIHYSILWSPDATLGNSATRQSSSFAAIRNIRIQTVNSYLHLEPRVSFFLLENLVQNLFAAL